MRIIENGSNLECPIPTQAPDANGPQPTKSPVTLLLNPRLGRIRIRRFSDRDICRRIDVSQPACLEEEVYEHRGSR